MPVAAPTPSARVRSEPEADPSDETGLREWAYWALLTFWFTIPWEGVVRFGGDTTIARLAGGAAFLVGLVALLATRIHHRPGEFVVLTVLFTSWVALSSFWTQAPSWTSQRTTSMAQLALMVLLTWEFGHSARRLRGLMGAFVAGCTVIAVIPVLALLTGVSEVRYTAPGTHPGDLSFALTLAIPIAWYVSLVTPNRLLALLYRAFIPLAVISVVLSAARAAFISLPLVLLVIPLTIRYASRVTKLLSIAAVAVGTVGAVTFASAFAGPLQRLSTTSSEISSGTLDHRTELWAIAFRLIGEHPFLGVGAGASRVAVGGVFTQERGLQDTYFSVGAELGLIGLSLFLLICLSAIWRSTRRTPLLERRFAAALAAIFLYGQIPRHADYVKNTWAILVLLALFGAVMAGREPDEDAAIGLPPVTEPQETATDDPAPGPGPGPRLVTTGAAP